MAVSFQCMTKSTTNKKKNKIKNKNCTLNRTDWINHIKKIFLYKIELICLFRAKDVCTSPSWGRT